ncbi:MAG: short-chain dehydrogenase [Desulfatitalea sp. BRH_c12]|nr:MAG: short-chain dehydrogenase [Desulfatitalea sp. BRH_c12]
MRGKRDFRDKTVVITGAAGGMGAAFARRFGMAGARLALLDVNPAAVAKTAQHLGAEGIETMALACDVSEAPEVIAAIEQIIDRFGGIDVLINNAGISARAAFDQTRLGVFHKVMAVNFFGALYGTKAAMGSLRRRRGLIITISSLAGFTPLFGRTAYAASKHALHGLFDSLRSELRGSGVNVLVVCPGFTATGIGTAALDGDGTITRHPQSTAGTPATPQAVAEQVFRAAAANRRLLVLSPIGRAGRAINKLSPALYEWLMVRSMRKELAR